MALRTRNSLVISWEAQVEMDRTIPVHDAHGSGVALGSWESRGFVLRVSAMSAGLICREISMVDVT